MWTIGGGSLDSSLEVVIISGRKLRELLQTSSLFILNFNF